MCAAEGRAGRRGGGRDWPAVVEVTWPQVKQLIALRKSFLLCWYPQWQRKRISVYLKKVCQRSVQDIVFVIIVRGGCDAEQHVIESLRASTLPLISGYREGGLAFQLEAPSLSDLAVFSQSLPALDRHTQASIDEVVSVVLNNPDREGLPCLRVFIAGDRSSVGKTSICWALLSLLVDKHQVSAQRLAYCKPATQCEAPQTVSEYCEAVGIAHRGIGPVVFYQGFTRAFLSGQLGLTSADLLQQIREAVDQLCSGKRLVLLDGVGYPAVGSIVGVSNADVATTLRSPVVLVGKSGVGDAVDSYNLNAAFFALNAVPVLGGIFNKLEREGFYNRDACAEAVTSYFALRQPHQMPFGFVPVAPAGALSWSPATPSSEWMEHVAQFVDLGRLLHDIWLQNLLLQTVDIDLDEGGPRPWAAPQEMVPVPPLTLAATASAPAPVALPPSAPSQVRKRSRDDVESDARASGAKGG